MWDLEILIFDHLKFWNSELLSFWNLKWCNSEIWNFKILKLCVSCSFWNLKFWKFQRFEHVFVENNLKLCCSLFVFKQKMKCWTYEILKLWIREFLILKCCNCEFIVFLIFCSFSFVEFINLKVWNVEFWNVVYGFFFKVRCCF